MYRSDIIPVKVNDDSAAIDRSMTLNALVWSPTYGLLNIMKNAMAEPDRAYIANVGFGSVTFEPTQLQGKALVSM